MYKLEHNHALLQRQVTFKHTPSTMILRTWKIYFDTEPQITAVGSPINAALPRL